MGAFASYAAAEVRAYAKVADKTWNNAFAHIRDVDGTVGIMVQRKMSPSAPDAGAWVFLDDDAAV